MLGRIDYHFYRTLREMIDRKEVTHKPAVNLVRRLGDEHWKWKLQYRWEREVDRVRAKMYNM